MKEILYIGNKLVKHGATPTSVDTLTPLLRDEGYTVTSASSAKNRALRMLHMLGSVSLKRNIDLVLIDTYSTTNFWYAVFVGKLCQILSKPYIMILHGGNLETRLSESSRFIQDIFKKAKTNVVPSNFLKDKLKKFQWGNLKTVPNSIELSTYPFLKRSKQNHNILWVRAFDKVYNPKLALETLQLLITDFPDAELCMIGPDKDGSLNSLLEFAKKNSLPVTFKGKVSKVEWIDISKDFDLFLNTTNFDNTPVSLIEAMALGLPVVSTNVGGVPFLIEDQLNGVMVEPDDPAAMSKAIKLVWSNPELSEKLSVNGRTTVESFDWQKVKPLWLELLG